MWFFAEEETLKEYGKNKLEDKILLMGMRYEKKDFPRMYGLLFSIGVNSVIWNNGADAVSYTHLILQPVWCKIVSG